VNRCNPPHPEQAKEADRLGPKGTRRMTENRGKNPPGVDGKVWNTPEQKMSAAMQ
jgi:hypothetical protein